MRREGDGERASIRAASNATREEETGERIRGESGGTVAAAAAAARWLARSLDEPALLQPLDEPKPPSALSCGLITLTDKASALASTPASAASAETEAGSVNSTLPITPVCYDHVIIARSPSPLVLVLLLPTLAIRPDVSYSFSLYYVEANSLGIPTPLRPDIHRNPRLE